MKTNTASNVAQIGGRSSAPANAEIYGRATRKSITPPLGPQWVGVPSHGHCPISGLSRPHIYNLINDGLIRSACLRQPGAIRGRRLIYLPSLLAYLDRMADAEAERLAQSHEGAV